MNRAPAFRVALAVSFPKYGRGSNFAVRRPSCAAARKVRTCTWSSLARRCKGNRSFAGRLTVSVSARRTMAAGGVRRPESQARNVSTATPRAAAHSACERPRRLRIALRADGVIDDFSVPIGDDHAIHAGHMGSEWRAMRWRQSAPDRTGQKRTKVLQLVRCDRSPQRAPSVAPGLKPRPTSRESGLNWRARRDSNAGPPA